MVDVRMPDGTVIKNVPAGTPREKLLDVLKRAKSPLAKPESSGVIDTIIRGAAQGATFNLADEISAGVRAFTQPILGDGSDAPTLSERYNANLEQERALDRANAEANPVSDIAANIAGSVVGPGKLMGAAKGVPQLIGQGAAAGAAYGFGGGEGGLVNRAKSATTGAVVGGTTGAAFGGATKLYNKVRPHNVAADYVNKQFGANPKFAQESEQIGKEIGQVYTPGQASGSRGLLTMEGLIRRHPVSADKMSDFDAKQLDTSLRNLNRNLDRLAINPTGPEATGNTVAKSFDDVVTRAIRVRKATANQDFGKVDELAGRYRVIQPNNLKTEIDAIAKDFDVPGGGDASAALVNRIQGIAKDLDRAGPQGLNARETQRLLEVYGDAARGKGKIFADLDTAQQRMIAGRLKDAVLRDIDDAADKGGHVGEIADALKLARSNYKQNSQAINELEKSVLGRMFGTEYDKAPERVAQTLRNMKPSEIRQSIDILNKADPGTSQSVKRFLVEDAMAASGINPASGAPQAQIAGEATFSPAKFLTAIRKSPVWAAFDDVERKNMETAVRDLERVAFRAGTDGSPTAPLQAALSLLSRPAGQVAGGAALGAGASALGGGDIKEGAFAGAAAGGLGGMAIPRLAAVITTPQGQRALRTLRISKPNSTAARAATAALVTMLSPKGDQAETATGE